MTLDELRKVFSNLPNVAGGIKVVISLNDGGTEEEVVDVEVIYSFIKGNRIIIKS
jgi:hypothetical protein